MSPEKEQLLKHLLAKIEKENEGKYYDFVLPGFLARGIVAYQSMRADLLLMIDACKTLTNPELTEVVKASLWHMIIAAYGKCFTDATSSKSPKLEPSECFAGENVKFLTAHAELMELRHNYIAHRGSTDEELGFGYMRMNIETLQRAIKFKQVRRIRPSHEKLQSYIELFGFLISVTERKFENAANKIAKTMLDQFTPAELVHMRIN